MTEARAALIADLKAQFDTDAQALVMKTVPLTDDDYRLVGKLIQLYCYADLNLRRIIDALRHAAIGPEARNASLLQDAQVFEQMQKLLDEHLWDGPLKDGLSKAVRAFSMYRVLRHNFAHWAMRRVGDADVLVNFTKNAIERERRGGRRQAPDEWGYGLMPLEGFEAELDNLADHGIFLAGQAAYIEFNLDAFREKFASEKAAAKIRKQTRPA